MMLGLYDAFAVNASFFLALVVRFYINGKFSELGVPYISAFFRFAPYYTVCSLIIFAAFNMYNMVWRVAGINDLKRIFAANICTFLFLYIGTHLLIRRMPTTYYIIGAVIQLMLVCIIRFIPRMLIYEGFQDKGTKNATPTMIVGVGTNAVLLQDYIRRNVFGREKVVCLLDYTSEKGSKRFFDGLPVVYGVAHMADAIKKYKVEYVLITERSIPDSVRKEIRSVCGDLSVEMRDFIIGMADDEENREWMRRYEEENGEEVSFF